MTDKTDIVERWVVSPPASLLTRLRAYGATRTETEAADEIERLRGILDKVALVVHFGGVAGLSEDDALVLVRRATMEFFDESMTLDRARAALNGKEG